eukprot:m.411194 g.411194  ORF g.411194 m.411194 type:complete len:851 (+) comp56551_c0_seq5:362-2914(+)
MDDHSRPSAFRPVRKSVPPVVPATLDPSLNPTASLPFESAPPPRAPLMHQAPLDAQMTWLLQAQQQHLAPQLSQQLYMAQQLQQASRFPRDQHHLHFETRDLPRLQPERLEPYPAYLSAPFPPPVSQPQHPQQFVPQGYFLPPAELSGNPYLFQSAFPRHPPVDRLPPAPQPLSVPRLHPFDQPPMQFPRESSTNPSVIQSSTPPQDCGTSYQTSSPSGSIRALNAEHKPVLQSQRAKLDRMPVDTDSMPPLPSMIHSLPLQPAQVVSQREYSRASADSAPLSSAPEAPIRPRPSSDRSTKSRKAKLPSALAIIPSGSLATGSVSQAADLSCEDPRPLDFLVKWELASRSSGTFVNHSTPETWTVETFYWQRCPLIRFKASRLDNLALGDSIPPEVSVRILRIHRRRSTAHTQFALQTFPMTQISSDQWSCTLPADAFRLGSFWKKRRARAVYTFAASLGEAQQTYWSPPIFLVGDHQRADDWGPKSRNATSHLAEWTRVTSGLVARLHLEVDNPSEDDDDEESDDEELTVTSSNVKKLSAILQASGSNPPVSTLTPSAGREVSPTASVHGDDVAYEHVTAITGCIEKLSVDEIQTSKADLAYVFPLEDSPLCGDQSLSPEFGLSPSDSPQPFQSSLQFWPLAMHAATPASGIPLGLFRSENGSIVARALTPENFLSAIMVSVSSNEAYLTANHQAIQNSPAFDADGVPVTFVKACIFGIVHVQTSGCMQAGDILSVGLRNGQLIAGADTLFSEGDARLHLGTALESASPSAMPISSVKCFLSARTTAGNYWRGPARPRRALGRQMPALQGQLPRLDVEQPEPSATLPVWHSRLMIAVVVLLAFLVAADL